MKKVFPLLLFVLLAFSSCQKRPVMYTPAEKPSEVVANAEKFVKQTEKRSSHYSAEDWKVALDQFIVMSKNYVEKKGEMSEQEISRFTAARLNFMKSVQKSGTEDLARQIKEVYSRIEP